MTTLKPMRIVAVLALVVVGVFLLRGPDSTEAPIGDAEQVLVVSIPTLTWDQVADEEPPNLMGLLGRSAVASASVRTIGADTELGEGYATIGAGNRAAAPSEAAGLAFPPDATFDGEAVADVYERRFGAPPADAEVLHLGAAAVQRRNDEMLYGTEVGTVGEALLEAGLSAAVVANGDLEAAPRPEELHREAALAVMDPQGRVRHGRVDAGLLAEAPDRPSGIALDPNAVREAASEAWQDDSEVLLVELSDLLRIEAAENVVTPDVAEAARADALEETDRLLGDLLETVDLDTDLVVVVSPVAPAGADQLVVAAVAGPGVEPGLARSGTARRDGYVTLPDIGPTVLSALGIDKPDDMNGAPIASSGGGSPDDATFRALADDNREALFRNRLAGPLTVIFIVSQVLTYCLAAYALTNRRMRWRRTAGFLLLAGMAVPLMSFVAGLFPYWKLSVGGALAAILAAAALAAVAIRAVVHRALATRSRTPHSRDLVPPLAVMAATAVLLIADIGVGGPLQIDTVFGYGGGAIVAGRLAGYGNLAWALMITALIISVTGLWGLWSLRSSGTSAAADRERADERRAGERPAGRRFGLGLAAGCFVLAVLAVGLPALGANVGGTLSVVSGSCIVLLLLAGVHLDLRRLVGVGAVTVAVLAVFGALDSARAPEDQTHLGRLIESTLGDEGFAGLATVIQRKINANLNILLSSVWSFVIPAALAFLAFLIWRPPQFLRNLFLHVPGMRACVIGVLATGVVGGLVNDSGIAIPAVMLTLLLPHVAYVIVESHDEPVTPEPVAPDPTP